MNQQPELTPTDSVTRIVALHSENVMRLKAVDLTPPEHLVIVAGNNEQGKSSLLRSIEIALQGADAFPAMPVRKGQAKAVVELDLGTLTVRRAITQEGGTSLTVKAKDGTILSSPQKILTELIGKRSFDPMEFMKLTQEKKADLLRRIAGLDFTEITAQRDKAYNERTLANRQLDTARTKLSAFAAKHADAPEAEQSTASILEEQRQAAIVVRDNESKRNAYDSLLLRKKALVSHIAEVKEQLSKAEKDLFDIDSKVIGLEPVIAALKDPDLEAFKTKLENVETGNCKFRQNQQREAAEKDLQAATVKAAELTRQIDRFDSQKADMIQSAKFPVEGLGFTDSGAVAVEGIPFEQCSTSKQLRVSVAMGLALNPKLRVLLIKNGNDLDDNNLKLLAEMAKEANAQVWLERVDQRGEVAVIIEDGMAKV